VWVAQSKHANYRAQNDCGELYEGSIDNCNGNVSAGRFAIYESHNIGGYNRPLLNCVASQNTAYMNNGRQECFHMVGRTFRGWQQVGTGDATDYYSILNSLAYECWSWSGNFDPSWCYWGPYGARY